jgi:hypothetical protein
VRSFRHVPPVRRTPNLIKFADVGTGSKGALARTRDDDRAYGVVGLEFLGVRRSQR